MNERHDSHFSSGFLLGLLIGGGLVFLLGTRSGKNLLRIFSEQGIDGILNLLEEYEVIEEEDEDVEDGEEEESEEAAPKTNGHAKDFEIVEEVPGKSKPRFFRKKKA